MPVSPLTQGKRGSRAVPRPAPDLGLAALPRKFASEKAGKWEDDDARTVDEARTTTSADEATTATEAASGTSLGAASEEEGEPQQPQRQLPQPQSARARRLQGAGGEPSSPSAASSRGGCSVRDGGEDWAKVPARKEPRAPAPIFFGSVECFQEVNPSYACADRAAIPEQGSQIQQARPQRQQFGAQRRQVAAPATPPVSGNVAPSSGSSVSVPCSAPAAESSRSPAAAASSSGSAVERPGRGAQLGDKGREEATWAKRSLCRYEVGIKQDEEFNVMRKLLVPAGGHMRRIAEATGAKLCVRGRGSGHLEGPERKEIDEPLQVCLTSTHTANIAQAASMTEEMLKGLHEEYRALRTKKGLPVPEFRIVKL